MSGQEQDNGSAPFHEEGGALIFEKPKGQEELARQRREDEQHEFARQQVETNRKLARFTGALVVATFCTIGIGIWQARISQRAANAAKDAADAAQKAAEVADDSFKLSRRHTEDTDEAIIYVRGETVEDGSNIYRLTIANNGKNSAHFVNAHIEISQYALPSDVKQRTFAVFDISQDELRLDTPILKEIVLDGFGTSDWDRIHALRESIRIEGRVNYDNGFDDRRNPAFCEELLTQPNPPGNTPPSMNVLVDCNRLPGFLPPLYKRLRERKEH